MKKNFKLLQRGGKVHLLKYEVALFGPQWRVMVTFSGECIEQCKRMVLLLNECNRITNKDNEDDRDRDIST